MLLRIAVSPILFHKNNKLSASLSALLLPVKTIFVKYAVIAVLSVVIFATGALFPIVIVTVSAALVSHPSLTASTKVKFPSNRGVAAVAVGVLVGWPGRGVLVGVLPMAIPVGVGVG